MSVELLLLLGVILGGAGPAQAAACTDACYQSKSVEYQRCRTIPPTDRAARVACFQRADAALQSCLKRCK